MSAHHLPSSPSPPLQIKNLLAFDNCIIPRLGQQCLRISWLLAVVTVVPFLCLVLIDGMIIYHVRPKNKKNLGFRVYVCSLREGGAKPGLGNRGGGEV